MRKSWRWYKNPACLRKIDSGGYQVIIILYLIYSERYRQYNWIVKKEISEGYFFPKVTTPILQINVLIYFCNGIFSAIISFDVFCRNFRWKVIKKEYLIYVRNNLRLIALV